MIKHTTLTIILIIGLLHINFSYSQRLLPYSTQKLNVHPFKIIGSFHDSILVYAVGARNKHMVYTFDKNMNLLNSFDLNLPPKVFDEAFIVHGEVISMLYQYKKNEKQYLDYISFSTNGKEKISVHLLKEKSIASIYDNEFLKPVTKEYGVYLSDNSNYTLITRRTNYNDSVSLFTFLLDKDLNTLNKDNLNIPLNEDEDIDNICIDNQGTVAFLRTSLDVKRNNLCIKFKESDKIQYFRIQPEYVQFSGNNLLLPDNRNNSFIYCSTYFTGDNLRGIYLLKWDKKAQAAVSISKTDFQDVLLNSGGKLKTTDHLFLTNIRFYGMSDYLVEATIRPESNFPQLDNFNINYYNPAKSIVVVRYDDSANVKWFREIESMQDRKDLGIIGFNSFLSQKGVWKYLIEEELSSGIVYVSLRSINDDGKLSEEMTLNDTENYINGKKFIRPLIGHGLAINENEFIFPYNIDYSIRLGLIRW